MIGTIVGLLVATGISSAIAAGTNQGKLQPLAGSVKAAEPTEVDFSALPAPSAAGAIASNVVKIGPLAKNGKVTGDNLAAAASTGAKPAAGATSMAANNNGGPAAPTPLCRTSCFVHTNFDGVNLAASNCGCQPPDVNAAISKSYIVETVNLDIAVYNKSGGLLQSTGLNTFFGTTRSLSDPRVLYDNAWNRWVMTVIPVPATSTDTPALFLATSKGANPTGLWNKYQLTFSGGSYPAGTLLDYPQLGMDSDAVIVSSNNFQLVGSSFNYIGSAVWAAAKQRIYNGLGLSFPAFADAFSTAPSMQVGIPQYQPGKSYLLAASTNSGGQMLVYYMTNTARPDSTTLVLEATVAMPYAPPPRRVNQPGTTQTLDPLDGRIAWAPMAVSTSGFVWFTHGIAIGSFPGVQYGAVHVGGSDSVTTANAFHDATSDDFNPSIGITDAGGGGVYLWLNWAYTDTPNNRATSDTFNVVPPGAGVPALTNTDTTLVVGSSTSEFRFGDYSSVAVDPGKIGTCGIGKNALVAQQYFAPDGSWRTRLAEVGFC